MGLSLGSPLTDRRTAYLLVGIVAAAVYLNSLPNRFAYDDLHIIEGNESVHSLETLPGAMLQPYWPGPYGPELGLWRPVTTGLFGLQWVAGGGEPMLFHAVNVVMHVVASLLVLALLLELLTLGASFAGAVLFAVHPVHVEAVANVVGQAEIVSTACVLGACLVHIRAGPRPGWRTALVVGLLYLVGFGAKEGAVTLPGLVFLLDAARSRIGFRELPGYVAARWRTYLVMLLVAAAMLVARHQILGSIASPFAPLGAVMLTEVPRIWTLGEVWVHYVRLWVFPLDLSSDYSPGVIPISFGWHLEAVLGVGLALAVLALSLHAWRRPHMEPGRETARAFAFGVVWFLIAISPISNTIFVAGVVLAERTLYLPSVGLAVATGWVVVRLARDRARVAWAGLAVAVLASSVRVWTRNPDWYDSSTVMTVMIRDYPQSGRSQWVLGDVLLRRGRTSEGLLAYRAAIDLLGTDYQLMTEMARRLMREGRYATADVILRFAARESPELPTAHGRLALVRAEYGDAAGTEMYARRSLELFDADPTRHHLLAWALAAQGRYEEAREARARGLERAEAVFWQQYVYEAYMAREAGDTAGARAWLDSAWERVNSDIGRAALDSVRVSEFGLESLLAATEGDAAGSASR